ncbi:hypothetical protein [Roseibium sp.]|uniref:hypothetical protein n=1 Tax=Roseibium sp. TaxID=1936156 RepID=UPI003264BDF6
MFTNSLSVSPPHCAKTRLRLLSLGAALVLVSGAAVAQDTGKTAFEAYADGLKELGLGFETGAVDYDSTSDTLTISDSTFSMSGTIKNLPADDIDITGSGGTTDIDPSRLTDLTYDIKLTSGTVTITGFSHERRQFEAAHWVYSDDTRFVVTASAEGKGRLKIDGRLAGASATDYSFMLPQAPAEDPQRPLSRWLPAIRAALLTSFEEIRVDNTGMTMEAHATEDGTDTLVFSGTMQLDGYRMADAADGRVGEHSFDSVTQNFRTRDPASGSMLAQETRQGKTIYSNIDSAALVDLFDPDVSASGDTVTLIGSGSTIDYSSRQDMPDGIAVDIAIDSATMSDLTVTKRDNTLLALFDGLLAKKAPAPEELITGMFQLYRSFGITDARISGIKVTMPTPEPEKAVAVNIAEMAMSEVGSNGIGEMILVGLDAPDLPDGGSLKIDWAAVKDIEFADYTPMRAMISTLMADPDFGEEHPLDVARAFMPRSFGYEVKGLDVAVPQFGRTRVGSAEMTVATTVPPLPTSFHVRNEDIRFPVSAVEDPEVRALFRALGLDTVVWSDETRLYWDDATLELRLERMMLDIEGLGRAEFSARFANVPRTLFEDPENQGQMALIVAQFVEASLTFKDAGLTSKGIAHVAEAEGIPENVFREALIAQVAEATAPIGNQAFTRMVNEAASRFLNNPGDLRIKLAPKGPVPLAQILGSLAAPQTLPDLLNVSVTAD